MKTRVVYWILLLFSAALVVNAVGHVSNRFEYPLPPELVEILRLAVPAALGLDAFNGIKGYLKTRKTKRENGD